MLSAVLLTLPTHGALTLNGIGSFTYTPSLNYAGPDAFTYKTFDGQGYSDPATVQISVLQVNDAPISEGDVYTAVLNQPLIVGAAGVLANDHDVEVEDTIPLRAQLVGQPVHGAVTLQSDGSFVYTPNPDFLGSDQFTYASVDHFNAVGTTATVTITVAIKAVSQAVNSGGTVNTGTGVTPADPFISSVTTPSAASVQISQGVISASQPPSGYTFLNQQVNITILNQDGTELTASPANPIRLVFTIDGSLLVPGQGTTFQIFRNGVLIPECPGLTTIPSANFDPCVTAREGGAALNNNVRVTVISSHASRWNMGLSSSVIGDAPKAQNDGVYQIDFQTPLVVAASGILGNDYGRNALTAVLSPGSTIGGTVDLAASGAFRFVPAAAACGPASFKYVASDGTSSSAEDRLSILINCKPVANTDAVTVLEDSGTSTITVLSNDTDPDPGQVLIVTSVTAPAHGLAAIAMAGKAIAYTPAADYFGADSFGYTISDGRGGTSTATVAVTVASVNDAPAFTKGANLAVNEDAPAQSIANWATGLSVGPANESGQLLDFIASSSIPAMFSVQPAVSATGTLTYTPAPDASGVATVTVKVHDNGGITNQDRRASRRPSPSRWRPSTMPHASPRALISPCPRTPARSR